ncbi:MAG: ATP-binding protein [Anaerolineales bacterium]
MTDSVQSLTDLLDRASARRFLDAPPPEDLGLAEHLPFPFLAMVGQPEMKLALMLSLVNPNVGGVLLIGPRGTGKTTAVRSLADLMPDVDRSRCPYGCLPQDVEAGGIDAICPDCATRYAQGEPLAFQDRVRLIDLPLNSQLEDVVGGLDERAALHQRLRLKRGLLAQADQNILYVDEVNLLQDEIVDAILDAAAQGTYSVRRGPIAATYRSRFVLVGSMNPEEGHLRPQILDRFGLRVIVRGLESGEDRLEAYRRAIAFRNNPRQIVNAYQEATEIARLEVTEARRALPEVTLTEGAEQFGLEMIEQLGVDSLRAEITLFEAARAHAVADGRDAAEPADVQKVAPMSLRLRQSAFMDDFFAQISSEEDKLRELIELDPSATDPNNDSGDDK